jgi:hypothetical protein
MCFAYILCIFRRICIKDSERDLHAVCETPRSSSRTVTAHTSNHSILMKAPSITHKENRKCDMCISEL